MHEGFEKEERERIDLLGKDRYLTLIDLLVIAADDIMRSEKKRERWE